MRAIDADAFKEYITSACEDTKHLFNDGGAVAKLITEGFCKDIDEQPTIQPEIVRCKDCKHYRHGLCMKASMCVNKSENGFCDWGER